jgi:hypothetical protein
MSGNWSILLFSSMFIFIVTLYLSRQSRGIDILDVYIIYVLFHFGLYPFVRGLHFGRDIIFDFTQADPLSLGLVFAHVLIILLILKLFSLIFIKNMDYLKITYIMERCSQVNGYLLFIIYSILIVFQVYSYYQYGVQSFIPPWDFERIGKLLPYWFTSMRTIYNLLTFCICLVLLSKVFKTKDRKNQILWLILTIIFVPFASMYGGKRFFINVLILSIIFYFDNKNEKLFKLRNLAYGLILALAVFLFCNLYESYRDVVESVGKITSEEAKKLKDPLSAAINYKPTLAFLSRRPGTWEFSYLILSKQVIDGIAITKGKIIAEGFKSAVPRCVWHNKSFLLIDDMLAQLYGVRPKEIDIGKNNYGVAQLEVGYYSVVILPLVILMLLILMSYLNKLTNQNPFFLWLFSGNILFYLINIEEAGTDIFFLLRHILLILFVFVVFILVQKTYISLRAQVITHK